MQFVLWLVPDGRYQVSNFCLLAGPWCLAFGTVSQGCGPWYVVSKFWSPGSGVCFFFAFLAQGGPVFFLGRPPASFLLAFWLLGFWASWLFGFLASWLLGFLAFWLFGCLAVWLCVHILERA